MTILPYALGISLIAITISMFLCLIRLIIGPSVIDRLLALDTLFLNATCLEHYWLQCLALFRQLRLLDISQRVMSLTKEMSYAVNH